ncbi:hypothetical protein [Alicycliphilus denitrificans]|uniref:hypothetical protein n=1 Tax=Alicycliphilus denitrificans TaxID=179636 RepID=UPI0001DA0B34|nr:hypothetical protein [Alicycliphilus denitrificans]ADV01252.1 excinuclease ABC subunit C [Alicycliphilus denitrificans BC]
MNKRTISAAEARAILLNDEAESLPFRIINDAGRSAIAQFVNTAAAEPERHSLNAWYAEAEQAANDAGESEAIVIEMGRLHAASRTPCTLELVDSDFDWTIND